MRTKNELKIVITPVCNYRCSFCNSDSLGRTTPVLLSPQDYRFVAKAMKKLWGWDSVEISGGEPLTSSIYRETCELIANEDINVATTTNASLIVNSKELLVHNKQINVTLPTMNPTVYARITGSPYPLNQIINTISAVRACFPEMKIRLNSTVVRNENNSLQDMRELIQFANTVGGEMNFSELMFNNPYLVVPSAEIESNLISLGFSQIDKSEEQTIFERNSERAIVTKVNVPHWNVILQPDGTALVGNEQVHLLHAIQAQNIRIFAQKVELSFYSQKSVF